MVRWQTKPDNYENNKPLKIPKKVIITSTPDTSKTNIIL